MLKILRLLKIGDTSLVLAVQRGVAIRSATYAACGVFQSLFKLWTK
jgi:hypothetical protein